MTADNKTPRPPVSPARLHQKSGTAFGGFAKVQRPDGSFRMKPTGGKKP